MNSLLITAVFFLILASFTASQAWDRAWDHASYSLEVRPQCTITHETAPPPCTPQLLTEGLNDWLEEQSVWAYVLGGDFGDSVNLGASRRLRHRLFNPTWTSATCTPELYPNQTAAIVDHDAFEVPRRSALVGGLETRLDFDVDLCGRKETCHYPSIVLTSPPPIEPPVITCLGPILRARVTVL